MEFNKRQMYPFKSEPISDLTEVYTGTDLVLTTLYELSGFHGDSRWKQGDQGKSGWLHVAPHHGCFRLIGPGWTWYNLMIPNAGKNAKGFDWSFHEFPPPPKKKYIIWCTLKDSSFASNRQHLSDILSTSLVWHIEVNPYKAVLTRQSSYLQCGNS